MMALYLGIGAGVAATRVFLALLGVYSYERQDSTWVLAKAVTDVLWWWLVIAVLILETGVQRVQHR